MERKTTSPPMLIKILVPIVSILMVFVVISIFLFISGANLVIAFGHFFGFLATKTGISETIVKTIPILLISLGLTIAFKCNAINIGAEGQLIVGAIAGTWVGIAFAGAPTLLIVPLILIFSFIIGGLWGGFAGTLKAKLGINEIIVTVMMTYIASYLMDYMMMGPLTGGGGVWPRSQIITPSAWLPRLFSESRLHAGIFIAMLFVVLVWMLLSNTILGYRIKAVGVNKEAARFGGIEPSKILIIAMVLSGGLAGIAGAVEVMGVHHCLLPALSAGYGYVGIAVSRLGRLHPGGVVIASLGFSAIIVGLREMLSVVALPQEVVLVAEALTLIFVMVGELLTLYDIRRA